MSRPQKEEPDSKVTPQSKGLGALTRPDSVLAPKVTKIESDIAGPGFEVSFHDVECPNRVMGIERRHFLVARPMTKFGKPLFIGRGAVRCIRSEPDEANIGCGKTQLQEVLRRHK